MLSKVSDRDGRVMPASMVGEGRDVGGRGETRLSAWSGATVGLTDRLGLVSMGVQHFDVVIVGAGFGGIGAAIQFNRLGYDNIVISTARTTWVERGMSIAIRAFPSINRRPRIPTGSSRTRTGRGCMPRAPN